jgi:hypothetical protein
MSPLSPFREIAELERPLGKTPGRLPGVGSPPTPQYDRAGALAYARKYWLKPCDDGFVALGPTAGRDSIETPAGTVFEHEFESDGSNARREHALLPDGKRIEWRDLDDCTHFISCCIGERPGERCGGLPITYRQLGEPPTAPYGIVRVSTMVQYLVRKGFAEIVAEKSTDDSRIDQLAFGDLVAYFNVAAGAYTHLTILLGDGNIACHTYGRSDQPDCTWDHVWDLGRGTHTWTFIRIVV